MLRFLGKSLLSSSRTASTAPEICNLSLVSLLQYQLSKGIANGTNASLQLSDPNKKDQITVSYLTSSCGLSPTSALTIAKRFCLKSFENADSILKLLNAYGFSDADITAVIMKSARLLKADAEKILKPKLEFLRRAGLDGDALVDVFVVNPSLLYYSMEKIEWCFNFYSANLPSKLDVIQALKCTRQCLDSSCEAQYKYLQDHGLSNAVIVYLLKFHSTSLMRKEHLLEAVETVKELGISPTCQSFSKAVGVIASVSKDGWLRKVQNLRELGWSDEEVFNMFRMMPSVFALSDENIRAKLKFFEEEIGWGSALLSKYPHLLTLSLQQRTKRRFLVLKQLMSRGLISLIWRKVPFIVSNHEFCRKYVDKFKDEAPEIVEYFQGNTDMHGQK